MKKVTDSCGVSIFLWVVHPDIGWLSDRGLCKYFKVNEDELYELVCTNMYVRNKFVVRMLSKMRVMEVLRNVKAVTFRIIPHLGRPFKDRVATK